MKVGWQGSHLGDDRTGFLNNQFVTYRFNNGVPNQVTQTHQPLQGPPARPDLGVLRAGRVDAAARDVPGRCCV